MSGGGKESNRPDDREKAPQAGVSEARKDKKCTELRSKWSGEEGSACSQRRKNEGPSEGDERNDGLVARVATQAGKERKASGYVTVARQARKRGHEPDRIGETSRRE